MKAIYTVALAATLTGTAWAAEQDTAEALHQKHCVSCHDSAIYTRDDRRVTSLPGLHAQVRRCEQALGLRWFDDDVAGIAGYLNERYYRFR